MKRTPLRVLALSAMAALTFTPSATADVEVGYGLDLVSAYVWRGITFTEGLVHQPSITVAHSNGFSLNVWGTMDLDDYNGIEGEFFEVDITLSYAFPTNGKVSFEVGMIDYLFPNFKGAETKEVYASVGWDLRIAPTVAVYYDFDEFEDFYATFSIASSIALGRDNLSFDWELLAAYAGDDFAIANGGGTGGGLFNGLATAALTYAPDEGGTVSGFVAYTDSLDTDVLVEQPVDLFAGVSFSRTFN